LSSSLLKSADNSKGENLMNHQQNQIIPERPQAIRLPIPQDFYQENPQQVYSRNPYQSPYPGTIPQARPKPQKKSRLSIVDWLFIAGILLCLLQGFFGIQPLNFSGNYKSPQRYEGSVNNPQGQAKSNAFRWDGE
jgi:hypothetical protein